MTVDLSSHAFQVRKQEINEFQELIEWTSYISFQTIKSSNFTLMRTGEFQPVSKIYENACFPFQRFKKTISKHLYSHM